MFTRQYEDDKIEYG